MEKLGLNTKNKVGKRKTFGKWNQVNPTISTTTPMAQRISFRRRRIIGSF
jgi:hypothetical protein